MFQPVFSLKTHDTDYGPVYVYSVLHPNKDKIVPTPVFLSEHYEYRGYELRMMSRVEYTTCVKIEKIKQNNKTPKNNPSKRGRKVSKSFQFGAGSILAATYHQKLLFKQAFPM